MRPSVRAEKYTRDASSWRKDVTDGNDNGTDGPVFYPDTLGLGGK